MSILAPVFTTLTALAFALVWLARVQVAEGQVAVLRRWQRSSKVLGPGSYWRLPVLDRIERREPSIGRSVELHDHEVSADGTWHVQGRVYFQIVDAPQAAPALGRLEETVTEELDRLLPEFLPEHRDEPADAFNQALKQSLNARLRRRGILVARTQIRAAA
ncbi:SPFH domain-containing protein [Pseudofulvimonas gallinarii]|jgi:uncharacterized membrane protein YqiK|uniref:SPFH domain/Band 7 family protein n=1 Tax=Pseudofulvimonas gallinarii TaxID=634155 RepID=A0A4V2UUZ7_9GAMM|nr:SPFH domain-containing protein [Pseudofulvimonas gallinarii]TCS93757.1 SPFH domain/Band 7 family protein [Pseudofulvimonas gallinarii]